MLHSKKDRENKNLNRVVVQIGAQQVNRDLLDFKVYRGETEEYTVGGLLETILDLEADNERLRRAIKALQEADNDKVLLLTNAVQILSKKAAQMEKELSELKDKCKYL